MKQLLYNLLHEWLAHNAARHYREHALEGYYESCPALRCRLGVWVEWRLMPDWWFEL